MSIIFKILLSKTKELDCLKKGFHFDYALSSAYILEGWIIRENHSKLQREIKHQNIKDDDVSF